MSRERSTEGNVSTDMPAVTSLLALAIDAGNTTHGALAELVACVVEVPAIEALGDVVAQLDLGADLTDVVDWLPSDTPSDVIRVLRTLDQGRYDGLGVATQLRTLASEFTTRRADAVEAASQRMSVTLLFPLVLCVLPAFALLALAPLVLSVFQNIRF